MTSYSFIVKTYVIRDNCFPMFFAIFRPCQSDLLFSLLKGVAKILVLLLSSLLKFAKHRDKFEKAFKQKMQIIVNVILCHLIRFLIQKNFSRFQTLIDSGTLVPEIVCKQKNSGQLLASRYCWLSSTVQG